MCGLVFAPAGAAGGVLWAWLTDPASYLVTERGAFLDEQGLAAVFNSDGWFLVVGLVAGLALGLALGLRFRRHGWPIVVAMLLAAGLASALAYTVGHALGPDALGARLQAAQAGDRVAAPLTVQAPGVLLGWPIAAMAGMLAAALGWHRPSRRSPGRAARE